VVKQGPCLTPNWRRAKDHLKGHLDVSLETRPAGSHLARRRSTSIGTSASTIRCRHRARYVVRAARGGDLFRSGRCRRQYWRRQRFAGSAGAARLGLDDCSLTPTGMGRIWSDQRPL